MHRGDDLSEKNQVLLMEHSETKPFVNSLAPEKSFCLEIFIFYCLEACAGLSDDIFFFFHLVLHHPTYFAISVIRGGK